MLADDHVPPGGIAGKMQCRLAGRIAASDQINLLTAAQHGLARPGTVVNTCAEQAVLVRQAQSAVIDPGGADRGASDDLCPVFEMADPLAGDDLAANTRAVDHDLRAQAACPLAGA